ncbi:MAG: hypothetical protein ABIV26_07180 [Candidatus Limnocylindrales bacterium]
MGNLGRRARWIVDRRTGLPPRLRRVAGVVRATVRDRGPVRELPERLLTALLAPVRVAAPGEASPIPRDRSAERRAASERLTATAARLADREPASLRLAVIADEALLAELGGAARVTAIRPEDWAIELDALEAAGDGPDLLVVTTTRHGNGGAWTHRIAWTASSDWFLMHDLRALVGWFAARDRAAVFVVTEPGSAAVPLWTDAAAHFDLVLVPDAATGAAYDANPDRRGVSARLSRGGASVAAILAAAGAPTPAGPAGTPTDGGA